MQMGMKVEGLSPVNAGCRKADLRSQCIADRRPPTARYRRSLRNNRSYIRRLFWRARVASSCRQSKHHIVEVLTIQQLMPAFSPAIWPWLLKTGHLGQCRSAHELYALRSWPHCIAGLRLGRRPPRPNGRSGFCPGEKPFLRSNPCANRCVTVPAVWGRGVRHGPCSPCFAQCESSCVGCQCGASVRCTTSLTRIPVPYMVLKMTR